MRVLTLGLVISALALAAETRRRCGCGKRSGNAAAMQHLLKSTCGAREGCSYSACTDDPELGDRDHARGGDGDPAAELKALGLMVYRPSPLLLPPEQLGLPAKPLDPVMPGIDETAAATPCRAMQGEQTQPRRRRAVTHDRRGDGGSPAPLARLLAHQARCQPLLPDDAVHDVRRGEGCPTSV